MLEDGRLDSFMVEPPCTTCSPAQHPASRSYQEPRGYDPTDPKTLRGTTLALRSLALLQLAADLNTPGLLEQPRRSKMRRLSEWQTLVLLGRAEETWTASCMWGSPHQKEFIFLTVHMEASVLHRKCDKSHSHIGLKASGPSLQPPTRILWPTVLPPALTKPYAQSSNVFSFKSPRLSAWKVFCATRSYCPGSGKSTRSGGERNPCT